MGNDDNGDIENPTKSTNRKAASKEDRKNNSEFGWSIKEICDLIVNHPAFDNVILLVIIFNSILLSLSDFSHVTSSNDLSEDGSTVNAIIIQSEIIFTIIFAAEMVLKMIAFGLFNDRQSERKAYFSDNWNWLDFLVVVFAILSLTKVISSKNLKVFRAFRVLRPLKSIKTLPEVAAIVTGMFRSLGELRDILITISFAFFFFTVVGLQIFSGPYMHTRCRLTPFPVNTSWVSTISPAYASNSSSNIYPYVMNYTEYRCLNAPNFNIPEDQVTWEDTDSPWYNAQPNCYWPYDTNDPSPQLCSLTSAIGSNICKNGANSGVPEDAWRWCGSNYDALGNARFDSRTASRDTYNANMGYGFINFDNFGYSLLFVVQVFSGDSWSSMMFQLTDSVSYSAGVIFCSLLILFGTFFLLQLNVALLQKTFLSKRRQPESAKLKHKKELSALNHTGIASNIEYAHETMKDTNQSPVVKNKKAKSKADKVSIKVFPLPSSEEEALEANSKNCLNYSDSDSEDEDGCKEKSKSCCDYLGEMEAGFQRVKSKIFDFIGIDQNKGLGANIASLIDRVDRPQESAIRKQCRAFVKNPLFEIISTVFVLINTGLLAYNHYPMDQAASNVINATQFIITLFALFEVSVGLFGRGIVNYFSNNYRFFDFLIVISSTVVSLMYPLPCLFTNGSCETASIVGSVIALRSFRCFTIFRVLKLDSTKVILARIARVVKAMQNFLVVLFLFVFLFALIGMQFFANLFRFDADGFVITEVNSPEWTYAPDQPRSTFDNFTLAFLTVFQIITIDNWSTVMFNCGRALGPAGTVHPVACFLLGTFFVTNLFLAMLVDNFLNGDIDAKPSLKKDDSSQSLTKSECNEDPVIITDTAIAIFQSAKNERIDRTLDESLKLDEPENAENKRVPSTPSSRRLSNRYATEQNRSVLQTPEKKQSFASRFIEGCGKLLNHVYFETLITLLVCISCVSLAMDNPLNDPNSQLVEYLFYVDTVITVLFTVEMVLKILVFGAFHDHIDGEEAYFKNGWNILDFFVVVVSILSIAFDGQSQSKNIGVLRVLRSLRPLKIIQKIPGLRIIVLSLIVAIPSVGEVGIMVFMVYFIFSVFFTSFLNGQLRSCDLHFDLTTQQYAPQSDLITNPPNLWSDFTPTQKSWFGPNSTFIDGNVTCRSGGGWPKYPCCSQYALPLTDYVPTSRYLCECWGGNWAPITDFRFDNVAMGMVTLFDSATIDNWSDNMHYVSDSTGIDMQPVRDSQIWWYYVYLIFILIGNFICIQLFVGVIVKSFEDCRGKVVGSIFITAEQQEWVNTSRILLAIMPKKKAKRPHNSFRGFCYDIVHHKIFRVTVTLIIVIQCVVLSALTFGQSSQVSDILDTSNLIIAVMFAIEFAIKFIALGSTLYFSDWWNRAEFVIFLGSVGYLLEIMVGKGSFGMIGDVLRISRLLRVVFIVREIPTLKKFLDFMLLTVPAVGNITILVFFCIYIFTVIGVNLFAKTAFNGSYYPDSNFRSFGSGFVTLFRMTTADNWGQYMYDLSKNTKNCVVDPPYNASYCGFNDSPGCLPLNGCGSQWAFPFWILYIILMTFVLLSVFISVIISNYSDLQEGSIRPQDLKAFALLWSEFDPEATCLLPLDKLKDFVGKLFVPFGFGGHVFSHNQYMRRVAKIKIMTKKKEFMVHFHDVISALSVAHFERKVKWNKEIQFDEDIGRKDMIIKSGNRNPLSITSRAAHYSFSPGTKDCFTVRHFMSARVIQNEWKARKRRGGLRRADRGESRANLFTDMNMLSARILNGLKIPDMYGVESARKGQVLLSVRAKKNVRLSPNKLAMDRSEFKTGDYNEVLEDGSQIGFDGSIQKLRSDFNSSSHSIHNNNYSEEEWCVSDIVESKEMLSQLVVEIPMDEDDVAVVTASRRKPKKKKKQRGASATSVGREDASKDRC